MTEVEATDLLNWFTAAWAARNADPFVALWHPEGNLYYPYTDRVVKGVEIGKLNDLQKSLQPNLRWRLIDWTLRQNVVVMEWETANRYGDRTFTWRGVDKITLRDGRIVEETVYTDTAPLYALRAGKPFAPLMTIPN